MFGYSPFSVGGFGSSPTGVALDSQFKEITVTRTFTNTGTSETYEDFIVPPNIYEMIGHVYGNGISGTQKDYNNKVGGPGGAYVRRKFDVTPGETLRMRITPKTNDAQDYTQYYTGIYRGSVELVGALSGRIDGSGTTSAIPVGRQSPNSPAHFVALGGLGAAYPDGRYGDPEPGGGAGGGGGAPRPINGVGGGGAGGRGGPGNAGQGELGGARGSADTWVDSVTGQSFTTANGMSVDTVNDATTVPPIPNVGGGGGLLYGVYDASPTPYYSGGSGAIAIEYFSRPATQTVFIGIYNRASRYRGVRSDAQLYLGSKMLFPEGGIDMPPSTILGPEKVTDSGFDNAASWRFTGGTIQGSRAVFNNTSTVDLFSRSANSPGQVNKKYRFSVMRYSVSADMFFYDPDLNIFDFIPAGDGLYEVDFTASANFSSIGIGSNDPLTGSIDNLSLREVTISN